MPHPQNATPEITHTIMIKVWSSATFSFVALSSLESASIAAFKVASASSILVISSDLFASSVASRAVFAVASASLRAEILSSSAVSPSAIALLSSALASSRLF